ncbi:hypothetical protein NE237_025926 [Protea cynaroides]|uniref:Uncharacterized protein n=1 Tax=Protea cynaroides TaxID=273540 RepID=A0A9Q0H3Y9_9MAGN|nr:hypothetical protein NE237_025926 [Protea cynaroides]
MTTGGSRPSALGAGVIGGSKGYGQGMVLEINSNAIVVWDHDAREQPPVNNVPFNGPEWLLPIGDIPLGLVFSAGINGLNNGLWSGVVAATSVVKQSIPVQGEMAEVVRRELPMAPTPVVNDGRVGVMATGFGPLSHVSSRDALLSHVAQDSARIGATTTMETEMPRLEGNSDRRWMFTVE